MEQSKENRYFMERALKESFKALPACRPNPPVGCVLVRNREILASGFTHPPGAHHAEADALSKIEGCLSDVTAYVTLEPCSFHGRTPSCAVTLIERKIARVCISIIDPHPKNQGKGIKMLQQAGIEVILGVLEKEVSQFLQPYLI